MFSMCKSKILFLATFFMLTTYASANTCTESFFYTQSSRMFSPQSNIRVDSIYINNQSSSWKGKKYIYNNGIIEKVRADFKNENHESAFWIFYRDTNETVLKNDGYEYIVSEDKKKDTSLFYLKTYYKGDYQYTQIIRTTSNYFSVEVTRSDPTFSEMFLKNDSIIETETYNYNTDSSRTKQTFIVANLNDDTKCEQYDEEGNLLSSFVYKPNENGYSIVQSNGDDSNEIFVIYTKENTTSIRKTRKPVKIAPKARYFDLLGRYKFTK